MSRFYLHYRLIIISFKLNFALAHKGNNNYMYSLKNRKDQNDPKKKYKKKIPEYGLSIFELLVIIQSNDFRGCLKVNRRN